MQLFKHRFDGIKDYLHHRPPYLMLDRVVSISAETVVAEKVITGEESFIPGHFPGASIVPGAMLQEMTTQAAGVLIAAEYNPMAEYNTHDPFFNELALGVLVKVKRARYRGFARPGDKLEITAKLTERLESVFEFQGVVKCNAAKLTENSFQLTNLRSSLLQGQVPLVPSQPGSNEA